MNSISARRAMGIVVVLSAGLALSACNSDKGDDKKPQSAPQTSKAAAPAPSSDRLDLTLAGTVNDHVTRYNNAPKCTWDWNDLNNKWVYNVSFPITIKGQEGTFGVLINDTELQGGNFEVAKENVSVDGPASSKLHWGGAFGSTGSSGTVTINPDHSGTIDGAIKARSGPNLKGDGTLLQVKGSWSCAQFHDTYGHPPLTAPPSPTATPSS
ncbi:hypothetical protein NE235_10930 [Actinoallomurus spadix]|uniref:Lipoprotein n=1 Tax=Actinoallomurus spadix TaxID=79912 RepID=A0ABN0WWZ5_9ACTN|nr:hypothetical protein [Actinoallomurus spadix]MCO5986615.1 hypothetical protein [Actinoallomurus spadix]